ncbi:unnamed protein product [Discula destructiva]
MNRHAYVGGLTVLVPIFLGLAAAAPSVPIVYCATINTASTSANFSTYQSDGLCYGFCNDQGYALGVVQSNNCWCSDYVPGDTVDTSECESSCPGYPTDYCGGDDTFGYMKLDAAVSGTKGATSSTTSTTSTSSSTSTSESSESAEKTSSSDKPTTTPAPETTSSSSDTPSVVTSVKTVTSDGQVVYQTITSTPEASAGSGNNGLSGGAIAGIVIGILAVLAAFIAGALIYRRHQRNRQSMEGAPLAAGMAHRRGSSAGIMSKTGTMSSSGYGMGMEEDMYGSHRMSMKPMDPRLDPKQTFGLYRAASHDSINTLRDDHDYSRRVHQPGRVLRVTNMGPTDDNP